ncbi:kinase [Alteromonadaceae bacterium BrNp21-10]|nr:kinase [Alteromonadaceae bacterium BrNp21-10]
MLTTFIQEHRLDKGFEETAQQWFVPFAEMLHAHQKDAKRPFFVGVNGCQGSGKSTLSDFLKRYFEVNHGLSVVVMSLDDFYYSREDRNALARNVHPLLQTRGVPGTHDVSLVKSVLDALATGVSTTIPRFNKAVDDTAPISHWTQVPHRVDMVIFEGWCWGVPAQDESNLSEPINELERKQDPQSIWRQYVNRQVRQLYSHLYQKMNYWIMLKAPSFDCVYQWRLQQEQKLAAISSKQASQGIMSEAEIANFIQYYQRLTEHGLRELPALCNTVFELDNQRQIQQRIDNNINRESV